MYFADCPKCGKPDSSANGFDLCNECQEAQKKEEEEQTPTRMPEMQLLEVNNDDRC